MLPNFFYYSNDNNNSSLTPSVPRAISSGNQSTNAEDYANYEYPLDLDKFAMATTSSLLQLEL